MLNTRTEVFIVDKFGDKSGVIKPYPEGPNWETLPGLTGIYPRQIGRWALVWILCPKICHPLLDILHQFTILDLVSPYIRGPS